LLMSCYQNAGQNCNLKRANTSFENVARLKYVGLASANINLTYGEIKSRLNLGNAWYHSFQNLLSHCLLSKM
jgi:hypothetical protein